MSLVKRENLMAASCSDMLAGLIGSTPGTQAAAGTTQATATALTSKFVKVSGASGSNGVSIVDCTPGEVQLIKNTNGANALLVYPHASTHTFNGGTAGASVSIAANAGVVIWRYDATDSIALEIPAA